MYGHVFARSHQGLTCQDRTARFPPRDRVGCSRPGVKSLLVEYLFMLLFFSTSMLSKPEALTTPSVG